MGTQSSFSVKSAVPRSFSIKTAIPIALIVLIAGILCAKADQDVTVKVPFDFEAGGAHFSPGEYVLSLDKVTTGSVVIRSADHSRSVILLTRKTISASAQSAPVVSFRTYGDSRFLSTIQGLNASQRWELVPSSGEASLARTREPMVASFMAEGSDEAKGTK